jgi:hypothetical protein
MQTVTRSRIKSNHSLLNYKTALTLV